MKGVILAGGLGSRLSPLTKITNKHLLPVYNQPMIYYPINTLIQSGIKEILIISGTESAGDFMKLLGSGRDFDCQFTFRIQDGSGGVADALRLAESFAARDNLAVILGDNIFSHHFREEVRKFKDGAQIFLKEIPDPERFGVADYRDGKILSIQEKPKNPPSNLAVTGFYLYDYGVFAKIKKLKPSARNEYEITDINNFYIQEERMQGKIIEGDWSDAGTFESLFRASSIIRRELGSEHIRLSGK